MQSSFSYTPSPVYLANSHIDMISVERWINGELSRSDRSEYDKNSYGLSDRCT